MRVTPKKELSLFDSTCIIVGIIIGAGIYQMAPDIAKGAGSAWGVLGIWIVGGLLSLVIRLSLYGWGVAAVHGFSTRRAIVYYLTLVGLAAGFIYLMMQLAAPFLPAVT